MGLWYYLEKGKPKGPVTADEIIRLVQRGGLGLRDLIYLEGGLKWVEIQSAAEFQSLKNLKTNASSAKSQSSSAEAQWVLLAKKPDGSGYKQKGPFTTADLKKMLGKGDITKTDYVWREGFKEWYKILALPDFFAETPKPVVKAAAKPSPKETPKPLAKKVPPLPEAKVQQESVLFDNPTTASRDIEDIFEKTANIPMPEEENENSASLSIKTAVTSAEQATQVTTFTDQEKTDILKQKMRFVRRGKVSRKKVETATVTRLDFLTWFFSLTILKQIVLSAVAVVLIFSLTYGINFYLGRPENRIVQMKAPKSPILSFGQKPSATDLALKDKPSSNRLPKPVAVKPSEPELPLLDKALEIVKKKPAVEERKKGTFIRFNIAGNGTADPVLTLQTDASSHSPVQIEVFADPGNSLNSKSFHRIFTLRKLADREVNLVKKGVPPGIFSVIAKVDGQEWKGGLRLGTQDPEFNKKLKAFRKVMAFEHMDERYSFVKVSLRIEASAWRFVQGMDAVKTPGQWRDFYKNWKTDFDRIKSSYLKSVKMKNRNNYVHGWRWMQLIDARSKFQLAAGRANSEILKKSKNVSPAPREIAIELQKLKEAMLQQGLFDKID